MWSLRILSGGQAGESFTLKSGKNLLGRGSKCDVRITGAGVSKEHCEIHVYPDKVMLVDLNSSNGSYINGVKTQNGLIRLGDKISLHDIIMDITPVQENRLPSESNKSMVPNVTPFSQPPGPRSSVPVMPAHHLPPAVGSQPHYPQMMTPYDGNVALQMPSAQYPAVNPSLMQTPSATPLPQIAEEGWFEKTAKYIDEVLMPGFYKLASWLEFRYVLLSFVMLYIFSVSFLSMIPMSQVMKASMENEGGRRAKAYARTLADYNRQRYAQGEYNNLSTQMVDGEDGVKLALIVQAADGLVVAPASKSGVTAAIPKIRDLLKETKITALRTDEMTMTGVAPIGVFDPIQGEVVIKALAIVHYDMSGMKVDGGRMVSLFMQTLLISMIVGLLLYFIMYKMIEFPIVSLNKQLDVALKEKKDRTDVEYLFDPLQDLVNNINSLLARYIHGGAESEVSSVNKDVEFAMTAQIIAQPMIYFDVDGKVLTCNSKFEELCGFSKDQLVGFTTSQIPDVSLGQNLESLIEQCRSNSTSVHTDSLDFSHGKYVISGHALSDARGSLSHFVFVFAKVEDGI